MNNCINCKKEKGFTLIETLVAIGVFGIIIVAIFNIVLYLYKVHNYGWQQSVAIGEAERGVKTMVREVREAIYGDNGAFPLEFAGDHEFIFYSDIDKDGAVEKIRYFLGTASSGSEAKECVAFFDGGSCNISFDNYLQGELVSASVEVSVEGDFGWNNQEYADIYADGNYLGRVCATGCEDCSGSWQGSTVFDVTSLAEDGNIQFTADSNWRVDNICNWQESGHSMKAKFVLSWQEEIASLDNQLKKGVTKPIGNPAVYSEDTEEISIISHHVVNTPPIFEYYDENGDKIAESPARLIDTKMMKIFLVVNVDPSKDPNNFELESYVQLRNLK